MGLMAYLGENVISSIRDITDASDMTDEHVIYRYLGSEEGYLNGKLYYHNGTLFEPIGTGAGGGGGGGGSSDENAAVLTVQNTTGWLSKTFSYGQNVTLSILWSSIEDEQPTGNGTLQVIVNGVAKKTTNVGQGNVSVDVTEYLQSGNNTVRLRVSDVYGNARNINFSIQAVELTLASNFDTSSVFTAGSTVNYTYTPNGAVEKTVHFVVDGTDTGTDTITASGRQQTHTLSGMTHGAHSLLVYFEAEVDGETVRSNELFYDLVVVDSSSTVPIIASAFRRTAAQQYETLVIPYTVYTPNSLTSDVVLSAGGETVTSLTVDRTEHTWNYRPDEAGTLSLAISSGGISKCFTLTVTASEIDVEAETNNLALHLTSYGRSNNEAHPEMWQDSANNISATLTGFNFVSDGWVPDKDGITVLRVSGDARVTIPYKPFASDFRSTGKTIELEFASRNIMDYDATLISCMSGGRGFRLTAQKAILLSEQSEISTQYKEDEHVRISFVAEKRTEHRLLYIFINGIMSGVVQYPDNDDFSQVSPVNISIGTNDCVTDIYCIRVYDNDLTRHQILENWVADTQDIGTMLDRYERNNVYDEYGSIVIEKLPDDLPYLIISCPELPQYKGDKKTVSGSFVDPSRPSRSFTFSGAQADVQGTSSQFYARKNYKIKFNGGFDMTQSGENASKYAMNADAVLTKTFTFKADVASSEGANNVELVRLYEAACPYKTPPQEEDPKVRQGIDGFPIVIFWDNGTTVSFLGKYNFNNDKGTEEVFGFEEGDESWETLNNSGDYALWKSANYTGTAWLSDFEGRYPDGNEDPTNLQALAAWLVTTNQAAATGNTLATPYTDDNGTVHTVDNAAYRKAKFHTEAGDYMELDSVLFYYLFTELFLMVDSRAKNAFPSFLGDDKWCFLPYDMDTAIGIDNRGELTFGYSLEDTDYIGTMPVFNGQDSVLWINVRDTFSAELEQMYKTIRSQGVISYQVIEGMFEAHQGKWPEAIFNEDAWFKYIDPLTQDNIGDYLSMALGSKAEQRKWWLYNRFRYIDSKYSAGDSLTDTIEIRPGAIDTGITITPYADLYAAVRWDNDTAKVRAAHGTPVTIPCPYSQVGDNVIQILNASQLASVGDLSGFKPHRAVFGKATRLQSVKVGSNAAGYENPNLKELSFGNNVLLKTVDARNCTALNGSIDLSGAVNVEDVYFDGTIVTSVTLPVGGILKTLRLPGTITNLAVRNQPSITTFYMPSYANITTLRVENTPAIPVGTILASMAANSRVRIIGFTMTVSSTDDVEDFYDLLDTMKGLDENGNNIDNAIASGTIKGLSSITGAWLAQMQARYPGIEIEFEHITSNLYYYNYDGSSLLYTETLVDGDNGAYAVQPSRNDTAQYTFTFAGWSRTPNQTVNDPTARSNVTADRSVYAAYAAALRYYTVKFYNGSTLLQTVNDVPYGGTAIYTGTTPIDTREEPGPFASWNPSPVNITGATSCYAVFNDGEPTHTITDTWAQIFEHITAGDYATRYAIGDTMSLNLGSEGYVNAQIVAFDTDVLASDNSKTAAITWITGHALKTSHRMNPTRIPKPIYVYGSDKSFYKASSTASSGDYYKYIARNAYTANNVAQIAITVTAKSASTLRLMYVTGASSGNSASLKVNGTEVISSYSADVQSYDLVMASGTTYVIVFENTKLTDSDSTAAYIRLFNPSANSGTKTNVEALVTLDGVAIENCVVRSLDHYAPGTGSVGGYAASEMRTYVQETLKPLFPSEVRSGIKEVKKYSRKYLGLQNLTDLTNIFESAEDIWLPSAHEMAAPGISTETKGAEYSQAFPNNTSRIKYKHYSSTSAGYWLRSAGNNANGFYRVNGANGSVNSYNADGLLPIVIGFCTGETPVQGS